MDTFAAKSDCCESAQVQGDGLLPISPFIALQYHFGMLLGVDDFDVAQAYPRGKIRLHNAWLHRQGVVWGFRVFFNVRHELAVDPGLALDAAGHELHLDQQACLDIGKWYEKHKDDAGFTFTDDAAGHEIFDSTRKKFTVHVVAKFKACLTRPVPAIADPCDGATTATAYSRAYETVELLLRPGKAQPQDPPYPRLRILFNLVEDNDPKYSDTTYPHVRETRTDIQSKPVDQQPREYLKAFRALAAADVTEMSAQTAPPAEHSSIFPEDPTEVVLADVVDIVVMQTNTGWVIDPQHIPEPDLTVRPSHVATATIQELLCGPVFGPVDEGGPRGKPDTVALTSKEIRFSTTSALDPASFADGSFVVTAFDAANGWSDVSIKSVALDAADATIVVITLKEDPAGSTVRLVARGTGDTPLLGTNGIPLAGAVGGPPGSKHDGNDFVHIIKGS